MAAPILRVTVDRAEGPADDCGSTTYYGPAAEAHAEARLRSISLTAPEHGGYDKVDVRLTIDTGMVADPLGTVESRHDVTRTETDGTVRAHAIRHLSHVAHWDTFEGLDSRTREYREAAHKLLGCLDPAGTECRTWGCAAHYHGIHGARAPEPTCRACYGQDRHGCVRCHGRGRLAIWIWECPRY